MAKNMKSIDFSAVDRPEGLWFELAHVGINTASEEESLRVAKLLCGLFGVNLRHGNNSNFVSDMFEIMKFPMRGTHGHIAMRTNSVELTIRYFKALGFTFDESTIKYNDDGEIRMVYMVEEIAGFAFHFNLAI